MNTIQIIPIQAIQPKKWIGFHIEVAGKREHFDAFYEDAYLDFPIGSYYGSNETTKKGDVFRNFKLTKAIWGLSAYRKNEDGSIFGIQGLFAGGIWDTTEDGEVLLRLWDRII